MKTIIEAKAPQDFLALVPDLAGFQPVESIVLVAFRGTRSCGVLRVNLPHSDDPDVLSALASSLIGMVCKIAEVDAVTPVVYTDERFGGASVPPSGDVVNALIFHAEQSGFMVRDALCVASDGWASYYDTETPRGGHSHDLIARSEVNDAASAAANARVGSRPFLSQHGAPFTERSADFATRQRVAQAIQRLHRSAEGADDSDDHYDEELDALLAVPLLAERALCEELNALSDFAAATLLFVIQSAAMRDQLLMHWAFGFEAGATAALENEQFTRGDQGAGVQSAQRLWGEGPRPDPERLERAISVLGELVARAPRSYKPAALSMLAWLNWALGRGSRAGAYVSQALAIDARYSFAGLLHDMLLVGRLPEWAFAVPTDHAQERSAPDVWC